MSNEREYEEFVLPDYLKMPAEDAHVAAASASVSAMSAEDVAVADDSKDSPTCQVGF